MSSYSDLATSIINKNGEGGRFSGLNTALDLRKSFADAVQKYQFESQLAKEQGFNSGAASIINSSNLYGTDPTQSLQQFAKVAQGGIQGALNQPAGAGNIASGGTPVDTVTPNNISMQDTSNGFIVNASNSSSDNSGRNESFLQQVAQYNPGRAATIKAMADYRGDPAKLGGRFGQALQDQVNKYDPTFDAANYKERQTFIQSTWDKGELSKQRAAIENVTQHATSFQQYMQALNNGNVPLANALKNKIAAETGNPAPQNAATFARVVGIEAAKAISPTGVLTDEQQKETAKAFPENASPEQAAASVQNALKIMQPRMNNVLERYKERMGKYPTNAFSPEALNALQQLSPDVYNTLAPKLGRQPVASNDANSGTTGNAQSSSGSGQKDYSNLWN